MIKLTNRDGSPLWLNPDIVGAVQVPVGPGSSGANIHDLQCRHILIVQESAVDVAERVAATRSRIRQPNE